MSLMISSSIHPLKFGSRGLYEVFLLGGLLAPIPTIIHSLQRQALARELGIAYASICLVVNPAAGKSDDLITMDEIRAVIDSGMSEVRDIIAASLSLI